MCPIARMDFSDLCLCYFFFAWLFHLILKYVVHLKCFVQSGCYHCQDITRLLRILFFIIISWDEYWDDMVKTTSSGCCLPLVNYVVLNHALIWSHQCDVASLSGCRFPFEVMLLRIILSYDPITVMLRPFRSVACPCKLCCFESCWNMI